MLPIYKAVFIAQAPVAGGSTLPCLMGTEDENGQFAGLFVVKIYEWGRRGHVCPEVFGHVLATEFELQTPPVALIDVPTRLIRELLSLPPYQNRKLEPGIWFGSEYQTDTLDWSGVIARNRPAN